MKEPVAIIVSTFLMLFVVMKIYPRMKSANADKLNEAIKNDSDVKSVILCKFCRYKSL